MCDIDMSGVENAIAHLPTAQDIADAVSEELGWGVLARLLAAVVDNQVAIGKLLGGDEHDFVGSFPVLYDWANSPSRLDAIRRMKG